MVGTYNVHWKLFDNHLQNMQNIQSDLFFPIFVLFFCCCNIDKNLLIVLVDRNIYIRIYLTPIWHLRDKIWKYSIVSFLAYFFGEEILIKKNLLIVLVHQNNTSITTWEIIFDAHLTFKAAEGQNIEKYSFLSFYVIADVNTLHH